MAIELEGPEGRGVRFELGPAFQPDDAERLCEMIRCASEAARIEIDFHEVRECDAAALGQLARVIRSVRAHVTLCGMSQHQERLLVYLGFEPTAAHA